MRGVHGLAIQSSRKKPVQKPVPQLSPANRVKYEVTPEVKRDTTPMLLHVLPYCASISKKKREKFNKQLLELLNRTRAEHESATLILDTRLCMTAETVWNAAAAKSGGLVAIPRDRFLDIVRKYGASRGSDGNYFGCVSFSDSAVRKKWLVPQCAHNFWTHQGRCLLETEVKNRLPNRQLDEKTQAALNECRDQFMPILVGKAEYKSTRVGIYFGKSILARPFVSGNEPYHVVVVFG